MSTLHHEKNNLIIPSAFLRHNLFYIALFASLCMVILSGCKSKQPPPPKPKPDVHLEIHKTKPIVIQEVQSSQTKQEEPKVCSACYGTGTCLSCATTGTVVFVDGSSARCIVCSGTGRCGLCFGNSAPNDSMRNTNTINNEIKQTRENCTFCGGTGKNPGKEYPPDFGYGRSVMSSPCTTCGDSVSHYHKSCPSCNGKGYNMRYK